jgi:hypothetical protein
MTAEVIQFIPKPNPKREQLGPVEFNATLGQQAPWRDADSNAYHGGYCAPEKDPA